MSLPGTRFAVVRPAEWRIRSARGWPRARVLHAGHLGVLAALGIDRVAVRHRLRVAIVAFGNELAAPGQERAPQQIYDANTSMAAAFFERHGCEVISLDRVPDDRASMRFALAEAIAVADIVVTSGGMAVGDEDHTRTLVAEVGGIWNWVGIKMRPGRPASFARVGQAAVLGLPGNPFAALVALVVLGRPILSALYGRSTPSHRLSASASFQLDRSPGRAELFPALISRTRPELTIDRLGKGGSSRLRPLSTADGLGIISSAAGRVLLGDRAGFLSFDAIV